MNIIDSGEVDGVKSPEFLAGMEKFRGGLYLMTTLT